MQCESNLKELTPNIFVSQARADRLKSMIPADAGKDAKKSHLLLIYTKMLQTNKSCN